MHLKGRPVCLYAPSDVDEGYNVRSPQEPPDAQLKLEWVYPFMQIVFSVEAPVPYTVIFTAVKITVFR